ncbi:MAG TPA: hypothetical protein VLQ91_11430 [Draconibacterium sp.]|nr:hypothetical protein [Draconibacterium sp.]
MGIERDYLMRQLMMLFEVIEKIIRYRKKGEKRLAEDEIEYFYSSLNIKSEIKSMGIENLLIFLESEKKLTNEHIEMIAFVLKEQGELSETDENKINYFRKSYFLLDKVDRESITFSMDRQMKMAELRGYLN